jgi:hypothetical protein
MMEPLAAWYVSWPSGVFGVERTEREHGPRDYWLYGCDTCYLSIDAVTIDWTILTIRWRYPGPS